MVQSGDYSSNSGGEASADLTGLYAGYALILLAAPTFGAAAAIVLLDILLSFTIAMVALKVRTGGLL